MEPDSTTKPFRSLGRLNPLEGVDPQRVKIAARENTVANMLQQYVERLGYEVWQCIVRNPEKDAMFVGAACVPHQDAYDRPWFIVWSSEHPTVIVDKETKETYQGQPYELVLVDNDRTQHFKPQGVRGRWFARLSVTRKEKK